MLTDAQRNILSKKGQIIMDSAKAECEEGCKEGHQELQDEITGLYIYHILGNNGCFYSTY